MKRQNICLTALITILATVSMPVSLMIDKNSSLISVMPAQAQTTQEQRDKALQLYQLGKKQLDRGQYQEALETFEQVLVIVRRIGAHQGEAKTLNQIGLVYLYRGQYKQGLGFFEQALVIVKEMGDKTAERGILSNIGLVYQGLGQHEQALKFFEQVLVIDEEVGDKAEEGIILKNLGSVYFNLGQYDQALEFLEQSLLIHQKVGNKMLEGKTLNDIGLVYYKLGQYEQALKFFEQVLVIVKAIGDKATEATILDNIANVYTSRGQYEQALKFFEQALVIHQKVGNKTGERTTLNNLGLVSYRLGQYEQALKFFEQALIINKEVDAKAGEATILYNLSALYSKLGEYEKALKFLEEALVIHQKVGNKAGEGSTLNGIGEVYRNLGQYEKALKFLEQALVIHQKVGNKLGEGITLASIGNVYANKGQYDQSLNYLQEALVILKEVGDKGVEGKAFSNLGQVYNKLGHYPNASKTLFAALKILESLRSGLTDADKVSISDTQANSYVFLQNALVAQNKTNTALEIAERGRARAFVELLASRLSSQTDTQLTITPPTALQMQTIAAAHNATLVQYSIIDDPIKVQGKEKLRESRLFIWVIPPSGRIIFRWTDLKPLLKNTSLYNKVSNSTSIAPINPNSSPIVTASPELEPELPTPWRHSGVIILLTLSGISLIGLAVWSGRFLLTKKPVQPQKTKRRWLVPSVLFVLAISSSGGLVFLINRTQTLVQNPSPKNDSLLAEFVSNTRASVSNRETFFQKLLRGLGIVPKGQQTSQNDQLQQLHQILIDPIADLLPTDPNSPVIFIPQNSLFLVPFPALKDKDGKYLIEKHTILTAPSIQTLDLTRKQKLRNGESKIGNGEMLIVGNPTMPSVPPQIGEPPQQLPSLPGAEQEAKAIAKLLKTQAITGNQATKSAILKKMPSAQVIHLATHGILDEQRGLGSAIALAPNPNDPNKIGEVNGLLTAEEILDLKLNASLVVLSACDTGRGRITGDGVVGLSRSLISAGVPSVLVSLWSVPDAPTAFLMTEFYRNWQHNPDKAQALRQAMLTTMKQHPNPRDWAAFTLIGEAN